MDINRNTNTMKVIFISIFIQHWNLRRILSRDHNRTLDFVYFHTFSSFSDELPQSLSGLWENEAYKVLYVLLQFNRSNTFADTAQGPNPILFIFLVSTIIAFIGIKNLIANKYPKIQEPILPDFQNK